MTKIRFTTEIEKVQIGHDYYQYYWIVYKHYDRDGETDHFGIKFAYGKDFHKTEEDAQKEVDQFYQFIKEVK